MSAHNLVVLRGTLAGRSPDPGAAVGQRPHPVRHHDPRRRRHPVRARRLVRPAGDRAGARRRHRRRRRRQRAAPLLPGRRSDPEPHGGRRRTHRRHPAGSRGPARARVGVPSCSTRRQPSRARSCGDAAATGGAAGPARARRGVASSARKPSVGQRQVDELALEAAQEGVVGAGAGAEQRVDGGRHLVARGVAVWAARRSIVSSAAPAAAARRPVTANGWGSGSRSRASASMTPAPYSALSHPGVRRHTPGRRSRWRNAAWMLARPNRADQRRRGRAWRATARRRRRRGRRRTTCRGSGRDAHRLGRRRAASPPSRSGPPTRTRRAPTTSTAAPV